MKTTKKSLCFLLIALIAIIYFFNLGDLSPDIENMGFEERLSISVIIAILFSLVVLPFLGTQKMITLRNFLRIIIFLVFLVLFVKLRDHCEAKESWILTLTVTIPPFFISFLNLKRK